MSIIITAYGFVRQEVVSIGEGSEHLMVASSIICNADRDGSETQKQLFTILGFGEIAEAMKNLEIGDPVTVTGKLYLSSWRTISGEVREGLEIVVDQMLSARTLDQSVE